MGDDAAPAPGGSPPEQEQQAHGESHHDEIHMPPNSFWPAVTALGGAIAMVGVITIKEVPIVLVIGIVILLAGIAAWIRDARKEYQELP